MSDAYADVFERLKGLIAESQCPVTVQSVGEADCAEIVLEVRAICPSDPVLQPPPNEGIEVGTAGPWSRRSVDLVVTLPCDTGDCVTAVLSFTTKDADDAGSRTASFHWEFDEAGDTGIAEMKFSDPKTFKLDYFNVLPPKYVCDFVNLCVKAYDTVKGISIGDENEGYFDALVNFSRSLEWERFWVTLLERTKGKTHLHNGIAPSCQQHFECRAGTGLRYVYAFGSTGPRVELFIKGKKGMKSKEMFERLLTDKDEIEKRFGRPLGWERLDKKQTCRIRYDLGGGRLGNEASWPEIQDRMIDAMIRFEEAIGPSLKTL